MRKTVLFAALLPILSFPVPACAAKWVGIGTGKGTAQVEVDSASLHFPAAGSVRLWYRENHARPRLLESGEFSFSRVTALSEFQCDKRLAATIQRIFSAQDGTELKSERFDDREFVPVSPDSVIESVFNYACKRRVKPAEAKVAKAEEAPPAPPPAVAPPASAENAKKSKGKKGKEEPPREPPHWSYSGNTAPDKWGSLGPEYAACSLGQRQSPIDIRKTVKADLPPIQFDYKPVPLTIVDNGHSIKVDATGAGGIAVDGESYELVQFHFHKPGEEKINGKAYDLDVHLVHQSKDGRLAVVAVPMEAGKEHPLVRTLWTHLPLERDKPQTRADVRIDPSRLLPAKRGYYTFLGSLTTPPCTEGVLWLVLKTPVQVSKEQLAGFATVYRNNVRPAQPVNGRVIKESR